MDESEQLNDLIAGNSCVIGMLITPKMANEMLMRNVSNRPANIDRVKKYAAQIKNGSWKINGETIIFSNSGQLNDGQHRLMACVQANTPFRSDVRFGVDRDTFDTIDIGKKRTCGDVAGIKGIPNNVLMSSALSWVKRYQLGLPGSASITILPQDIMCEYNNHIEIQKSAAATSEARSKKFMAPSLAVALHYLMSQKDPKKADELWSYIGNGIGEVSRYDPRHVIRERLVDNSKNRAKISQVYIFAITVKAWNAYRNNGLCRNLRWIGPSADNNCEEFPEII